MVMLVKNGRVIDPKEKLDGIYDILVVNGKVKQVEKNIQVNGDTVIDAKGKWVVPGLIDIHVHLREPGFEHKETIETGSKSAARGGFTTICCMPNTSPVMDNVDVVGYVNKQAEQVGIVNVLPVGAITKNQDGKELADIKKMVKAGICAISEDGKTVMDSGLLKEAMIIAKELNIPMLSHCEDIALAKGFMNEGDTSKKLNIKGIGNDTEDIITARDIILAKYTGVKLHMCHVSTELSVDIIRFAKGLGVEVTAETAPHYFTLTDDIVELHGTNAKMNPPLRTIKDKEAIIRGLKDNTLNIIATDHAPHHIEEKNLEFNKAPFGIVGLETSFAVSYTALVDTGVLTPIELIEKMSTNPAKVLGIDKGTLAVGTKADITIIDPEKEYVINPDDFASKASNTPFGGKKVKGSIEYTIVNGKIVYQQI